MVCLVLLRKFFLALLRNLLGNMFYVFQGSGRQIQVWNGLNEKGCLLKVGEESLGCLLWMKSCDVFMFK